MSDSDRWKARVKNPRHRILIGFTGWVADKLGGSLVTTLVGAAAIQLWKSLMDRPRKIVMPAEPGHFVITGQVAITAPPPRIHGTAHVTLEPLTGRASGTVG